LSTRRLRRIRNERSRQRAKHRRLLALLAKCTEATAEIFGEVASGAKAAGEAFRDFSTTIMDSVVEALAREMAKRAFYQVFGAPPYLNSVVSAGPAGHRSAWEIGAQVNDRRHRAAPDGMVR
jgi:predicted sugar kinase